MFGEIDRMLTEFQDGRMTRREVVARIGAVTAALIGMERALAGPSGAYGAAADIKPTVTAKGINHIALSVTDVRRARDFYTKHLGLQTTRESANNCFMRTGDDFVALFRGDDPGLHHFAFTIDDYDPANAVKTLSAAGLKPERVANRVYFSDPDGIRLQVSPENEWNEP